MAQYRATIQGQRGEASRLGNKKSGIGARVNGWHTGVAVSIEFKDGKDVVTVYRTGGSGYDSKDSGLIAEWESEG